MATTIKLEGEARSEFGKGVARRLRVANKIPATIYAGGEEPAFVTLPMRETTLALRHTNALFTIASTATPRWPSSRMFSATR